MEKEDTVADYISVLLLYSNVSKKKVILMSVHFPRDVFGEFYAKLHNDSEETMTKENDEMDTEETKAK